MTKPYREVVLGDFALQWAAQWLANRPTLSQEVLKKFDGRGIIRTCLPPTVNARSVEDIDSGFVPDVSPREALPWLVRMIRAFLLEDRHHLCVFEDPMDDTHVDWPGVSLLTFRDEEVYYYVDGNRADGKSIRTGIQATGSACGASGFLTRVPDGWNPALRELSHDQIRQMAEATTMVFMDAYDDTGYILWQR